MRGSAAEHNNWLYPWIKKGDTFEETKKIRRMLLDDGKGIDAFHISSGSSFPHPRLLHRDIRLYDRGKGGRRDPREIALSAARATGLTGQTEGWT